MSNRPAAPLRFWLVLALAAIAIVPTLTTWGLARVDSWTQQRADQHQWTVVRQMIGDDVTRWRDPRWQRTAGALFAAENVEVALVDKQGSSPGPVFVTSGARQLLGTAGLAPALVAPRKRAACTGGHPTKKGSAGSARVPPPRLAPEPGCRVPTGATPSMGSFSSRAFRELAIAQATGPGEQRRTAGVADIWLSQPASLLPAWAPQAGGLITLLLTLLAIWMFLGRLVLHPLAAMSGAARRIADGELSVRLPRSWAREVADVATALESMSAGLRDAVARQTDLEQERRLFVGAVAHDLRTPLFTLSGYLDGLKDGVARSPERTAHYVEVCREQATALERLIADLFTFTRVEYLEQEPRRDLLDLGALLRQTVEHLEPRASAQAISLRALGPAVSFPFTGDAHLLTRAMENLLDNALRYTPPGGQITVGWRRETEQYVFTVEDTGPGIAAVDLPHLFTPLYRGETSRNRQTGGAGLGLTIAWRILRAHGGTLTAANGVQGGAILTGTLPVESVGPGEKAPGRD